MFSHITLKSTARAQIALFDTLNQMAAQNHRWTGLAAAGFATVDVVISFAKYPLSAIENCALVIFNLIGALFSKKCTLEDAKICFIKAGTTCLVTPIIVMLFPFVLLLRIYVAMGRPQEVRSFDDGVEKDSALPYFELRAIAAAPQEVDPLTQAIEGG